MSTESTSSTVRPSVGPEQWVELYGDFLFRYAKHRLGTTLDAEEVVQETFLAAIRAQEQFTGNGSQQGWLLRILRNKIVDALRLRERGMLAGAVEYATDPTALLFDSQGSWKLSAWAACPAEQMLSLKELWQIVKDCLAQIPPVNADVFVLSVVDDMDVVSISRKLNITPANVGVRLHRARLGLAHCVRGKWFPAEKESEQDD